MSRLRVVARLDVKNENVIKGIQLEGLRKVGDPNEMALRYYHGGVDEILFIDAVAAYYDRNSLENIIEACTQGVFVPITVGGGIRTIEDFQAALAAGADKVAINTQAIREPNFIAKASQMFGAQSVVISIQARQVANDKWEAYSENGREPSGLDVVDWVKQAESLGAGEVLLTSIDRDGTQRGFDTGLVAAVCTATSIPVIASGGAGDVRHVVSLREETGVDAIALGSLLHYGKSSVNDLKIRLSEQDYPVRLQL